MKMYPTPNARDWKDTLNTVPPSIGKTRGHSLGQRIAADRLKIYPTPTQDSASERTKKYKQGGTPLTVAVQKEVKMYPTPTRVCEEGGQQSHMVERTKSGGFVSRRKGSGITYGAKLSDAMLYLEKKPGGKLNPTFVEFLMGFPMNWTKIEQVELKLLGMQSSHRSQEN